MPFDQPLLRVLFFGGEPVLKGLEWALKEKGGARFKFQFYPSTFSNIPTLSGTYDLYLAALDLGQPVPLELLKKLPLRSGLCAFLQPTPNQLLQLAELPHWNALAWDGSSHEKLAARLDLLAQHESRQSRLESFVESCEHWLKKEMEAPAFLEWVRDEGKSRFFPFDLEKKSLSIGGARSQSDIKIPSEKETEELCEFRLYQGEWSLELFGRSENIAFAGNFESVRSGDQLQVEDQIFRIHAPREAEGFLALSRKLGFFSELGTARHLEEAPTLEKVIRELLSVWTTGELQVSSGLRNGSIYFVEGVLQQAVCGAVSGRKALLRMLGWDQSTWRLTPERRSELPFPNIDMDFSAFLQIYRGWSERWNRVKTLLPPPQVRLRAVGPKFQSQSQWSSQDYQVIAAVCEYHLVRDIFNNCSLVDVDILESLVGMRRQGIIQLQN